MNRFPLLLAALLCALPVAEAQAEIVGKVRVIDGDTLEVGGRPVTLFGLDAPEEGQTCIVAGKPWTCGRDAAFALAFETAEHWVRCAESGQTDENGIPLAVCRVGPYDLGALIVRKGWALADRRQSTHYAADEDAARAAAAGIWQGTFDAPWDWRARHRAP